MARLEPEAFEGRQLSRVFIAARLAEARLAEDVLTGHGVDFAVLVEPAGMSLLGSVLKSAVFCVAEENWAACAELLTRAGLGVGVLPSREPGSSD